jgi:manganese transport system substrate-binding protein
MPKSRARHPRLVAGALLISALFMAGCAPFTPPAESNSNANSNANGNASGAVDDRPLVVTTFTVIADMVSQVAGDRVRVESITRVGAEIHGYEPIPGDLVRAGGADLIIDNGLGLEAWFEQFLSNIDVPRVVASEGVVPIVIAGSATNAPNPHAWMSPVAAERYITNIRDALIQLDPAGEGVFTERAENYIVELRAVADELRVAVDQLPESRRALVTCEGAFSYLARDLGLAEAYIWPVNAEQQATPQRVVAAIDFVRERDVPAVFCESTVASDAMQQVAESAGVRLAGVLFVDSLSEPDGPVPDYLSLLRYDIDLIIEGLLS